MGMVVPTSEPPSSKLSIFSITDRCFLFLHVWSQYLRTSQVWLPSVVKSPLMKMWSALLCVSRWMLLLTLAAVIFQVDAYVPDVRLPCCRSVASRRVLRIKRCFEQKPREDCNQHAFLMVTKSGKQWCISPAAKWLKDRMDKKLVSLQKSLLMVVMLVTLVKCGQGVIKPHECCTKVGTKEITEEVLGYSVRKPVKPCVPAVIFYTTSGHYCAHIHAPWVRKKAAAIEKANAQRMSTLSPPKTTLLSILASTASYASSAPSHTPFVSSFAPSASPSPSSASP
uniref:uncharacterized protein LOC131108482 n=1 Tax=Doryrhamphus excisus TaxID=161450 RepID=UPI0025AE1D95|nr:uncharacterized protein LOC131108482 [Doryrhamphus excisus]